MRPSRSQSGKPGRTPTPRTSGGIFAPATIRSATHAAGSPLDNGGSMARPLSCSRLPARNRAFSGPEPVPRGEPPPTSN
jgi:hypothetical protein